MLPNTKSPVTHCIYRQQLKEKIGVSQKQIRETIATNHAKVPHLTQAVNRKQPYQSIEEENSAREDIVAVQIKAWRSILPQVIAKLSRIPDPRRPKSIKHQLVVLMIFGLLAFVFRLSSRREMNRELTGATVNANLRKIFPELESIPHADTLARLLEKTNPDKIESAHVGLIKNLISNKKFKTLLINNCIPISIDGAQKLFRDGILHDSNWLQRTVGSLENQTSQQYVYVLEANITLRNGLSIPLLTEYLHMDNNQLSNPNGKQDCELRAFERLVEKLKKHFPRLKIIVFLDALYATQSVMGILHECLWEYMINLPKNKLHDFADFLNAKRSEKAMIPGQSHYRGRRQEFYWANNIEYGYDWQLNISLVACLERREEVKMTTGEIEVKYSEHSWISSIPLSINNVHELCNLGARKKQHIEDNMNTEKNRGYNYKHLYSHNWNAMKCFHLLMRLGHAINSLSQFTRKLKKYINENGCAATLDYIKETLFGRWLTAEWYAAQYNEIPQLRFQME